MTTRPMQCQREAARFAQRPDRVDEIRRRTNGKAIDRLRAGDRAGALQAMYAGLAEQAPLTFKIPSRQVTP